MLLLKKLLNYRYLSLPQADQQQQMYRQSVLTTGLFHIYNSIPQEKQ